MKDLPKRDIPQIQELLTITPLYESFRIGSWNYLQVLELETFQGTIDSYCQGCDRDSVYKGSNTQRGFGSNDLAQEHAFSKRVFMVRCECTRNDEHRLFCIFRADNEQLTKIGQHPSLADLATSEIRKYKKPLGAQFGELSRAVGLVAHGIGIGSFVYLRRIFETLIEEARAKASQSQYWDEEKYAKARMDEKIVLLKDFLPKFLVDNHSLYSILSAGIHELDEETCLSIFEPVKTGIELILDDKLAQVEKEKKEVDARNRIATIKDSLKKS